MNTVISLERHRWRDDPSRMFTRLWFIVLLFVAGPLLAADETPATSGAPAPAGPVFIIPLHGTVSDPQFFFSAARSRRRNAPTQAP